MKLRHAAALALVGWYLIIPPLDHSWSLSLRHWINPSRVPIVDTCDPSAPISQWEDFGEYEKLADCQTHENNAMDEMRDGTRSTRGGAIRRHYSLGETQSGRQTKDSVQCVRSMHRQRRSETQGEIASVAPEVLTHRVWRSEVYSIARQPRTTFLVCPSSNRLLPHSAVSLR